jgi:hypothetical protein
LIDDRIDASRREVRKFGLLFSAICALVGGYVLYSGGTVYIWFFAGGIFFLVTGLFVFPVLRPIYVVWMKFAQVLAWVNTRIILGIAFYLIVTPMGLLLRLFGKDLLDQRINPRAATYWKKREQTPFVRERYERLF